MDTSATDTSAQRFSRGLRGLCNRGAGAIIGTYMRKTLTTKWSVIANSYKGVTRLTSVTIEPRHIISSTNVEKLFSRWCMASSLTTKNYSALMIYRELYQVQHPSVQALDPKHGPLRFCFFPTVWVQPHHTNIQMPYPPNDPHSHYGLVPEKDHQVSIVKHPWMHA